MKSTLSEIDLTTLIEIEPLLQAESVLNLPEKIEADYQAYKRKRLLSFRRMALLVGILVACVLSLSETLIYQDKWADLALLGYGLAFPYFVFNSVLVGSRFFAKHQELVIVQIGIGCGVIMTAVLYYGGDVMVKYIINTYILLLVFISGILQLSLSRSLSVIIPTLVLFNVCVLWVNTQSPQLVALYNLVYLGVALMVVYFNYQHAVSRRKQFLQMMVVNNEREKAKAIKAKLRTMSSTDPLTGVTNRQELDKAISSEWRRLCRGDDDLSIMIIDVDNFTQYNQQYGHKQGDAVLVDVAKAIQEAFKRSSDKVGRYEGDTFMVILPDTAKGEAELMCRSVCKRVRELKQASGSSLAMSVSIGVASCRPDVKKSYEDVVTQAQAALKQAKLNGKDQYCVASTRL